LAQEKIINGYKIIDDEELANLAEGSVTHHKHDDNEDDEADYAATDEPETSHVDYSDMVEPGGESAALDINV
jgi:hypothetical protein